MYPQHTTAQLAQIGTHLLNGWCAEFALRIGEQGDQIKTPVWTFPQAYYSALFSAKAVLATTADTFNSEDSIQKAIGVMATAGLYGPGNSADYNPYNALLHYRISSVRPVVTIPEGVTPAEFHRELIGRVNELALAHEAYILDAIGPESYSQILEKLPAHIRQGFVSERLQQLLTATEA